MRDQVFRKIYSWRDNLLRISLHRDKNVFLYNRWVLSSKYLAGLFPGPTSVYILQGFD